MKPSTENMRSGTFGERIALALAAARWTQEDLARAVEVSQPTVSRWMSGAVPRKRTAVRLADALKVDLDWLLTGAGILARKSTERISDDPTKYKQWLLELLAILPAERIRAEAERISSDISISDKDRAEFMAVLLDAVLAKEDSHPQEPTPECPTQERR